MNIIISASTVPTILSCPRKFILNYDNPERRETLATGVGTAIHHSIQTGVETGNMHEATKALLAKYPYELFLQASKKERASRSLLSCITAVDTTLNQLDLKGYSLATINGKKATELDFLLNLNRDGKPLDISYSGSIDNVLISPQGVPVITDYKTTTKSLELASLQYSKSLQAAIYAIVIAQALGIAPTDIQYQYIIIKLDNQLGEIAFERHAVTSDSLADAARYLRVYTNALSDMITNGYFPPQSSSCTSFSRPCWFANQCSNESVREALNRIANKPDSYRYAYLDTGKTDYDIKGDLSL